MVTDAVVSGAEEAVHHRCRWSAGDHHDTSMMLAMVKSDAVPCIRADDEHLQRASHTRQRVHPDLHTFGAKFQHCAARTPEVSPRRPQMGIDTLRLLCVGHMLS